MSTKRNTERNSANKNESGHSRDRDAEIREGLRALFVEMDQLCLYIDECVSIPKVADWDFLKRRAEHLRNAIHGMGMVLNVYT
jgi:hypothetical protein